MPLTSVVPRLFIGARCQIQLIGALNNRPRQLHVFLCHARLAKLTSWRQGTCSPEVSCIFKICSESATSPTYRATVLATASTLDAAPLLSPDKIGCNDRQVVRVLTCHKPRICTAVRSYATSAPPLTCLVTDLATGRTGSAAYLLEVRRQLHEISLPNIRPNDTRLSQAAYLHCSQVIGHICTPLDLPGHRLGHREDGQRGTLAVILDLDATNPQFLC